ncbi:hypothetical protein SAMN05660359_03498 [Geodermatophilus obscurus]|uniref:Uncharacterized protein n=2 Tax=Geodermatophilus obscurus TaxID=1861 RepID=A0A1I5H6Q8_9ACTN|nr:hypothetical protein SAMN05660359_03498 [Geodermatophilus obscurus]
MSSPAGTGRPVVTCLAGRRPRRARRWAVARVPGPGRTVVMSRRPRPDGAAGRDAAVVVRVLLLAPTGALVPAVLVDDPVGACPARSERAPGADPERR